MQTCLGFELSEDEYLLGGIQVNEPDHKKWVSSLNHHEMNTVSVTVYARSGVWNSGKLYYEEEDLGALSELKTAKENGLRVVFIPRVAIDHYYPENDELWHGMIMPKTDEDLKNWFAIYQDYLVKWGKIAEENKVEVFAVGSELKALTHTIEQEDLVVEKELDDFFTWYSVSPDPAKADATEVKVSNQHKAYLKWGKEVYHSAKPESQIALIKKRRALLQDLWKETIMKVREVYTGSLTYASNFDTYHNNALWTDLDIMGVNAYFKLRKNPKVLDQAELDASWKGIMTGIREFKAQLGVPKQPLVFTELGYTFKKYSSLEPWSYEGVSTVEYEEERTLIDWNNQPVDYKEREMCLTALKRTAHLPENSFFRGILYWKLSTIKDHEKIENFVLHISPDSKDASVDILREIFISK